MDQKILNRYKFLHIDFGITQQFYAYPTNLINPSDFFIIPAAYKSFIERYLKPGKQYTRNLEIGKVVVYMSKKMGTYARGMIIGVTEGIYCSIFALDSGYVDLKVTRESIFHHAHQALAEIPPLALHCEHVGCSPIMRGFGQEAIRAFRFLVGTKKVHIYVHRHTASKICISILNTPRFPINCAPLLYCMNLTLYCALPRNPPLSTFEWSYQTLEVGRSMNVIVQYGRSEKEFYVTNINDYYEYLVDRESFDSLCRNDLPIMPAFSNRLLGKAVGVKELDGKPFERAIVIDYPPRGNFIKVKLIDWGREIITLTKNVRVLCLPYPLPITPARAIYCSDPMVKLWKRKRFLNRGVPLEITIKSLGTKFEKPNIVSMTFIKPTTSNSYLKDK